jgi:hypothetical protein
VRHRSRWWVLTAFYARKPTHVSPRISAGAIESGLKTVPPRQLSRTILADNPYHICADKTGRNSIITRMINSTITIDLFAMPVSIAPRDRGYFWRLQSPSRSVLRSWAILIETWIFLSPRIQTRLFSQWAFDVVTNAPGCVQRLLLPIFGISDRTPEGASGEG